MFKTIGLIFFVFGAFCCEAQYILGSFDLVHKYEYVPMNIMKRFYISKTAKASWVKSHDICKSFGMELATFDIPNEAEQLLVNYRLHSTKQPNVWVGYTDQNHEGVWTSNKGKQMDKNISFHAGELNDKTGIENCLEINFSNNQYKFNDVNCNKELHFMCEHKTAIPTVDDCKMSLEKQESEFSSMNSSMNAEVEALKTENIDLKNKLQTLENSSEVSSNEKIKCFEEMAEQKQNFTTEIVQLNTQIEKLKIDLADKDTQIEKLKIDLADKDTQIEKLKIDLADKDTQIEKLKIDLADKDTQIASGIKTPTLNCDYEDDGQYYSCNSDNFEIINENSNIDLHGSHQLDKTESDVVQVNFVNCKTKRFSNVIFKHFFNLENLNIVNSSLNQLTQGVFNGAGSLRKLNIQGNNIKAVSYYVFEGAGALNVLKMENNNIESLSTEAFQGLNNLQTLSLKNNKIKHLPVSIFVDLNNLRYLVFSSNQLQKLDAKLFENNKEIREFWFDKNNLTKLDSEMFSFSPFIKRVVFTNNNCINMDSDDVCQEMFKSQVDGNCRVNNF